MDSTIFQTIKPHMTEVKEVLTLIQMDNNTSPPVWSRIGTARFEENGTLSITLAALPVNGEIHIPDLWGSEEATKSAPRKNTKNSEVAVGDYSALDLSLLTPPDITIPVGPSSHPIPLVAMESTARDLLSQQDEALSQDQSKRPKWQMMAKRCLDIMGASILLILISPIIVFLSLLIALESPGGAFFIQDRWGIGQEPFRLYKLRTMVANAHAMQSSLNAFNASDGITFKLREDPRVTRLGRWLRRWRLDELPQLWNVVKGEMSLVGPRPFDIEEFQKTVLFAPHYDEWTVKRHHIRPGITGPWQIGGGNDLPFNRLIELDLDYVQHWSLAWDLAILCQTVPIIWRGKGAY